MHMVEPSHFRVRWVKGPSLRSSFLLTRIRRLPSDSPYSLLSQYSRWSFSHLRLQPIRCLGAWLSSTRRHRQSSGPSFKQLSLGCRSPSCVFLLRFSLTSVSRDTVRLYRYPHAFHAWTCNQLIYLRIKVALKRARRMNETSLIHH
jgi:hypothetical protein